MASNSERDHGLDKWYRNFPIILVVGTLYKPGNSSLIQFNLAKIFLRYKMYQFVLHWNQTSRWQADLWLFLHFCLRRTTLHSEQDQLTNCVCWGLSDSLLFYSWLSSAGSPLVQRRQFRSYKYEPAVLLTQRVELRTLLVSRDQWCR